MPRARTDAPPVRSDGLQIEEHRAFQRRFWKIERAGWAAFAVLLILAAAGLTGGGGPLSQASWQTSAGSVTYPRVARWQTPDTIVVEFAAGAAPRSLTLSPAFGRAFQIETMQPRPAQFASGSDGLRLVFPADGDGPSAAAIAVRPRSPGVARWEAALAGGAMRPMTSLVLP